MLLPTRKVAGSPTRVSRPAELLMMASDTLEALGLKRGDYIVKLNNRKLLDGVLEFVESHASLFLFACFLGKINVFSP